MKKIVPLILLLVLALGVWYFAFRNEAPKGERAPKDQPVAVSKYSAGFNSSVNDALKNYYALSEALVNWDTVTLPGKANELKSSLANIKFDELKKDTLIYETASSYTEGLNNDLDGLLTQSSITEKRHSFHSFSQNFYDLLRTVQFDATKVYLQECPMAFNDAEAGIWLSDRSTIRNPYLGLHHPKYKSGMLECGETKDSLQFK